MSEPQNTEPKPRKETPKPRKATNGRKPAASTESNLSTPLLLAGVGAVGVAAVALTVAVVRERRSQRGLFASNEPSFWAVLARTALLSAARALTNHLLEKNVLPALPVAATNEPVRNGA
ncbi:MAG: hypothetical protein QM756_07340 [Polyangiaceae bacterium]